LARSFISAKELFMLIRDAVDEDIPAMVRLRSAEWGDEDYWTQRLTRYMHGMLSAQHALPPHAMFVAIEQHAIVGFVAGHRTTRLGCEGELEWINVAATHRGQGIAGQLIATMGTWFVRQHIGRVCVNADEDNVAARRTYARCGAITLNAHWMIWEDARQMQQPLT